MKSPKEFDYDLWIAPDGQYMVRVKATREKCAVSQAVFRKLRTEEKKLRREMAGLPSRNLDANGKSVRSAMLTTDYVSVEGGDALDSLWLADSFDLENDLILREDIQELRAQLTERQLEVFESCIIGGMSLRKFANSKGVHFTSINETAIAIRKKAKKILG